MGGEVRVLVGAVRGEGLFAMVAVVVVAVMMVMVMMMIPYVHALQILTAIFAYSQHFEV